MASVGAYSVNFRPRGAASCFAVASAELTLLHNGFRFIARATKKDQDPGRPPVFNADLTSDVFASADFQWSLTFLPEHAPRAGAMSFSALTTDHRGNPVLQLGLPWEAVQSHRFSFGDHLTQSEIDMIKSYFRTVVSSGARVRLTMCLSHTEELYRSRHFLNCIQNRYFVENELYVPATPALPSPSPYDAEKTPHPPPLHLCLGDDHDDQLPAYHHASSSMLTPADARDAGSFHFRSCASPAFGAPLGPGLSLAGGGNGGPSGPAAASPLTSCPMVERGSGRQEDSMSGVAALPPRPCCPGSARISKALNTIQRGPLSPRNPVALSSRRPAWANSDEGDDEGAKAMLSEPSPTAAAAAAAACSPEEAARARDRPPSVFHPTAKRHGSPAIRSRQPAATVPPAPVGDSGPQASASNVAPPLQTLAVSNNTHRDREVGRRPPTPPSPLPTRPAANGRRRRSPPQTFDPRYGPAPANGTFVETPSSSARQRQPRYFLDVPPHRVVHQHQQPRTQPAHRREVVVARQRELEVESPQLPTCAIPFFGGAYRHLALCETTRANGDIARNRHTTTFTPSHRVTFL